MGKNLCSCSAIYLDNLDWTVRRHWIIHISFERHVTIGQVFMTRTSYTMFRVFLAV